MLVLNADELQMLRNVPALANLLKKFEKRMRIHLETFKEHFMTDPDPSKPLRDALQAFYASIIMYCAHVTPWLQASAISNIYMDVGAREC